MPRPGPGLTFSLRSTAEPKQVGWPLFPSRLSTLGPWFPFHRSLTCSRFRSPSFSIPPRTLTPQLTYQAYHHTSTQSLLRHNLNCRNIQCTYTYTTKPRQRPNHHDIPSNINLRSIKSFILSSDIASSLLSQYAITTVISKVLRFRYRKQHSIGLL